MNKRERRAFVMDKLSKKKWRYKENMFYNEEIIEKN